MRRTPSGHRIRLVITAALFAVIVGLAASAEGRRPFGTVDEPLYAPGAISLANAIATGEQATLDPRIASHPPFGSLLLGLGLMGPDIFEDPHAVGLHDIAPRCVISSPPDADEVGVWIRSRPSEGDDVAVATILGETPTAFEHLPAMVVSCVDLVDHAALLLNDGSIVLVYRGVNAPSGAKLSAPLAGPWSAIAPLGSGAGIGVLARASDGQWWRIDDPVALEAKVATGFYGQQLFGIAAVGYLDGADAEIRPPVASQVARLLNQCAGASCTAFEARLAIGRAYLNGDVEVASRAAFRESLAAIAPVAYGHARLAIGTNADSLQLLDLDRSQQPLATIPLSATQTQVHLSREGSDGFTLIVGTKGRIYSLQAVAFPAPAVILNNAVRFDRVDGIYPASGDGLMAVVASDNGIANLYLMDTLRLSSISGRRLRAPATTIDPLGVSLRGGRDSVLLAHSGVDTIAVDTSAATARLRAPAIASGLLLVATVCAALWGYGALAMVAGGLLLMATAPLWDLSSVAMLDGLLAALLAVALIAGLAAIDTSHLRVRRAALLVAGILIGLAGGVKLSALVAAAPLLLIAIASLNWEGAAAFGRRLVCMFGTIGAFVSGIGLLAGAGFGALLNTACCATLALLFRRNPQRGSERNLSAAAVDALTAAAGVGVGLVIAFAVPVAIGISVGGVHLTLQSAMQLWLSEGAKIADGFLIDHPLGLPFWGLAAGLGVGFGGSVAPGVFAALWAGVARAGLRPSGTPRSDPDGAKIDALLLISVLSILVWAPMSRILFPWYAAPAFVPLVVAFALAFARRNARVIPLIGGLAAGPAIAWLGGPTLCLAAVAGLDRGCQAIGATDVVGTLMLVAAAVAGALCAARFVRAVESRRPWVPAPLRSTPRAMLIAIVVTVAVECLILALLPREITLPLQGFSVVLAMELIWGAGLLMVLIAGRRVSLAAPLIFGASLLALEAIRSQYLAGLFRIWYEAPTQVSRVIAKPLLHPVPLPLIVCAIVFGTALVFRGRVGGRVRGLQRNTPQHRVSTRARS